jgi:anti-sigma factor RsiW
MTPQLTTEQLAAQSGTTECAPLGETHLTGEQFGELMGGTTETASAELAQAEAHLLVCEQCAAEFASLREAISLFREASNAYADEELRSRPRWILPARRSLSHSLIPAYWVAATAMFLTALLPLQVMRRHTHAPPAAGVSSVAASNAASNAQSDEALLEDVNSEISASVPTSMQALADPTADASTVNNETSVPTTNQRKD